jgi:hypothetical protein
MTTINLYFADGSKGTVSHEDPEQISKWVELFSKPKFMENCEIAFLSITREGTETPLEQAA